MAKITGSVVYTGSIGGSNISLPGRTVSLSGPTKSLPTNTKNYSFTINAVYTSRRPSGASTNSWEVKVEGLTVGYNSREGTGNYTHNITSQAYTANWFAHKSTIYMTFSNTASGMQLAMNTSLTVTVSYTYYTSEISAPTNLQINGSSAYSSSGNPYIGSTMSLSWQPSTLTDAVQQSGQSIQYHVYADLTNITSVTTQSAAIDRITSSDYGVVAVPIKILATAAVTSTSGGATITSTYSNIVYFQYQYVNTPENLEINGTTVATGKTATQTWDASIIDGLQETPLYYKVLCDDVVIEDEISATTTIITGEDADGLIVVVAYTPHTESEPSNSVLFIYKAHRTVKYYDGTEWIDCTIYYYDGEEWIQCEPQYYDGIQWIDCSSQ